MSGRSLIAAHAVALRIAGDRTFRVVVIVPSLREVDRWRDELRSMGLSPAEVSRVKFEVATYAGERLRGQRCAVVDTGWIYDDVEVWRECRDLAQRGKEK